MPEETGDRGPSNAPGSDRIGEEKGGADREAPKLQIFPKMEMADDENRVIATAAVNDEMLDDWARARNNVRWQQLLPFADPVILLHERYPIDAFLKLIETSKMEIRRKRPDADYYTSKFLEYCTILSTSEIPDETKERLARAYRALVARYLVNASLFAVIQEDGYPWHTARSSLIDPGELCIGSRAYHLGCLFGFHDVFSRLRNPFWAMSMIMTNYLTRRTQLEGVSNLPESVVSDLQDAMFFGAFHGNVRVAARMLEKHRKDMTEEKAETERETEGEKWYLLSVKLKIGDDDIEMPMRVTKRDGKLVVHEDDLSLLHSVVKLKDTVLKKEPGDKISISTGFKPTLHHNDKRAQEIGDIESYVKQVMATARRQIGCLANFDNDAKDVREELDRIGIFGNSESEKKPVDIVLDILTDPLTQAEFMPVMMEIGKRFSPVGIKAKRIGASEGVASHFLRVRLRAVPNGAPIRELEDRCFIANRKGERSERFCGYSMRKLKVGNSFILVPNTNAKGSSMPRFDALISSGKVKMVDVRRAGAARSTS